MQTEGRLLGMEITKEALNHMNMSIGRGIDPVLFPKTLGTQQKVEVAVQLTMGSAFENPIIKEARNYLHEELTKNGYKLENASLQSGERRLQVKWGIKPSVTNEAVTKETKIHKYIINDVNGNVERIDN